MSQLPNEILDKIWRELCEISFEPRILEAKWTDVGNMRLPAFYGAQPQAFMTQLCRGAREISTKNFYSRVFEDPCTSESGFWWNEKDVLYIDEPFYDELVPSRKALLSGREKITRVAVDYQINESNRDITELIADWFPNLSQTLFLSSTRLTLGRSSVPMGHDSAVAKLLPITTFHKQSWPPVVVPSELFIRTQGIEGELNAWVPPGERFHFLETFYSNERVPFFRFERNHGHHVPYLEGSLKEDKGTYSSKM